MSTRTHERSTFLQDVIIAAVEGGTNHWARSAAYRWDDEQPTRARVILIDENDTRHLVTPSTIAQGIRRIAGADFQINGDLRALIAEANRDNDAGNIDAGAADAIVQAALFGELVYG